MAGFDLSGICSPLSWDFRAKGARFMNRKDARTVSRYFYFAALFPAQQNRISSTIDRSRMVPLSGNVPSGARPQFDVGAIDPSLELGPLMLMLRRSAAQQADLNQLLAEQQIPASPGYHRWLTPEQFADRFGIARMTSPKSFPGRWSEGLAVEDISRARNWIRFRVTAGQAQAAPYSGTTALSGGR